MEMKTISGAQFYLVGTERHKFPHTGPIYYGTGRLPYTAALKGIELKGRNGKKRLFKTATAAQNAIAYAAQTYPNGAPMFNHSGMMLDAQGNRSIFDDVAE